MTQLRCNECGAIARELREAYALAWDSSPQPSKNAWLAVYKMIGGTEEDADRAVELAHGVEVQGAHRIHRVIHRKFAREALTGHKIPFAQEW